MIYEHIALPKVIDCVWFCSMDVGMRPGIQQEQNKANGNTVTGTFSPPSAKKRTKSGADEVLYGPAGISGDKFNFY